MQNNPNLQPPPTDPLQQPTYLSQPPTQPQASPMHATRISATHGRPRVGDPISDFYGKYSTPHNQGCHIDFCVMMCSEKALKPGLDWLPGLSAMCHYTTFSMASIITA
jgi:hypothetical protein